jgi:holo-[acyl-carrier protein] synthase
VILGIGTDIVQISRIEKSLKNKRFLAICFTKAEIERCIGKGDFAARNFAGYFAAKEAVAKALGTGFRGFYPRDIEISHDSNGRPTVKLSSNIDLAINSQILISISHEKAFATAMAIILG